METSVNQRPFYALIVAAGKGERMGTALPKQYVKINGKTILRHTLDTFLKTPGLAGIRVMIDPAHRDLYEESVSGLDLAPPLLGGKTRKISVLNGLKDFSNLKNEDILLIHDSVRPLVKTADILKLVHQMSHEKAATLAVPVADTLRHERGGLVDRNELWSVQTPQAFQFGVIKKAHEENKDDATDDTSLVEAQGIHVKLVRGHKTNIKITTPDDLEFAKALMEHTENRTGNGFDVHAFDTGKKGPVRLCGIDVPHTHALAGHSDADVGLHAITDAILGAIAEGDIGRHFPPSDMTYKNMDSAVFLKRAVEMVAEKAGKILNLDLTLICEAPKITPHADKMIARVAEICGISKSRISIKATTTEKLGFTGRGEGIAAQAVATISLPWSAE